MPIADVRDTIVALASRPDPGGAPSFESADPTRDASPEPYLTPQMPCSLPVVVGGKDSYKSPESGLHYRPTPTSGRRRARTPARTLSSCTRFPVRRFLIG